MDIQAYIESGIIESYVLGLTSAEENNEVETFRTQYPEVESAINEFSISLEQQALENAVTPPAFIKANILTHIQEDDEDEEVAIPNEVVAKHKEEALIVPYSNMRYWRLVAAASVILLIVSAALNYYLYEQYLNKNNAYQALLSERQTLQANNQVYETKLKEWQSAATMMADPEMATVKMRNPKGQNKAATVFWNTKNKDVYVMANNLPTPEAGKQYQLWALVDGKPVDAGIMELNCTAVCKMKNIPKAQAFAITLEKTGGSPTPDLNALSVMGNI